MLKIMIVRYFPSRMSLIKAPRIGVKYTAEVNQ